MRALTQRLSDLADLHIISVLRANYLLELAFSTFEVGCLCSAASLSIFVNSIKWLDWNLETSVFKVTVLVGTSIIENSFWLGRLVVHFNASEGPGRALRVSSRAKRIHQDIFVAQIDVRQSWLLFLVHRSAWGV